MDMQIPYVIWKTTKVLLPAGGDATKIVIQRPGGSKNAFNPKVYLKMNLEINITKF